LGRYEILAPVGSGGMAAIYLAKIAGPAGFEKPLALKVIHSHLVEDDQFVQMFFDEARIASQLQHPNIVQIFELGEHEGIYFIAMEYLRGETVGAVIQRVTSSPNRMMDPRVACHIMMEASEGLQYAHELTTLDGQPLRLVHRDISPQNLFVTYSGTVKLMDFGIARAVGLAHSTRPGSLKGKFSYMAPEQVRGLDLDSRSDIFSMGVVLWEMLTGRRLFKGRNDLESLRLAGDAKYVPVGQVRTGIPPELDRVLARALAREPGDRYTSALELHTDLGIVAERLGSPISTHELATWMRGWFPTEIEKKRQLLSKALPTAASGAGASAPPGHATIPMEMTPSVSEPSGIRIRELAGIVDEVNQTTPSHSGAWDPMPPPPIASPGIELDGASFEGVDAPTEFFEDHTEPSRSMVGIPVQPSTRGRWVALIVGGMIATATVAVGVVFLLGYLSHGGGRIQAPTHRGSQQQATKAAGGGAAGVITPPEAGAALIAPTPIAEAGPGVVNPWAGSDGGATPAPETVTLRFAIEPPSAKLTVAGRVRDDPSKVSLPRSSDPVEVVVSAPGYHASSFRVTPDRDAEKNVALRRRVVDQSPAKHTKRPNDLIQSPYSSQ
jgi:serine/threonine-protein kinase